MSRFSRRGFEENGNTTHHEDSTASIPMAAGISSQFHINNPNTVQQSMAGYVPSPVNGSMQVMSNNFHDRTKTASNYQSSPSHYHNSNMRDGYNYDASGARASRNAEEDDHRRERRRSRSSNRSSSRNRSGHDYQYRQTSQAGGATPAPPDAMMNYSSYPATGANNVTPPSPTPDGVSAAQSAQSQLDATQRRPAYLLHRDLVIGKGSYGQVCIASRGEAEGHSSSRSGKRKKFACKCVMLRNDPKYIAKLQEEVNVLRELRGHDNVIRLFDVFCVDNELFIITELGRGGDLFHLLTTHPKHGVTEAYAAKTVAEMLSAVAFLHSRHICHRDLKLENWVLESGKDVWSPLKLIDFGLSTHFTPGHRLSRVVGSSYYVAPEVLKKSYTEACDLWSLGVIVYMLLSGAPPFYGKNDEAIKASIVHGEYQFPHELFRDVSDDAMAFVSCLLSYSIEYRYTAEQALTHPWLKANCDPDQLQRAKDGARGVGSLNDGYSGDAMQM
ncbi:hypothetical protein ACHAXS_002892 [Conticribra weissflogii]